MMVVTIKMFNVLLGQVLVSVFEVLPFLHHLLVMASICVVYPLIVQILTLTSSLLIYSVRGDYNHLLM